jgi:hypothetical protein
MPPSSPSTRTTPSLKGKCSSLRTVTQPLRRDDSRLNISNRRIPRHKFSTREYISGGLRVGSVGSPSHMMTSVSIKNSSLENGDGQQGRQTPTLQCTNQLSTDR